MFPHLITKKLLFSITIIIIIVLNLYTLSVAYPTMKKPLNFGGADLPRDFSVYYIAAWRLLHNPSQIFTPGPVADGEPTIYPSLTPYKYLPSFLVLISPLASLSYYQAFWVFDAIQFALLPLIALLLYKLLENKNPIAAFVILVAVLLLPYPMSGRGLSVSYFMSWAEGQAKIFLSFLLLVSFYLGYKGKPVLSGIIFALGAFDPRFAVLALPLFLFYNKNNLKNAIIPMILALAATNLVVLYPGVAGGFVGMVFGSGTTTPLYTPAWIPTIMLVALIVVNARQMADALKTWAVEVKNQIHSSKQELLMRQNSKRN
jgi:hypothetical protein